MNFEPEDEFEQELRQAFERRPAPPGLKRKLLECRLTEGRRAPQTERNFANWQRLAASVAIVAVLAGGVEWRNREERRKEEAAREQVLTALRITSRVLNHMNSRLVAHGRATQD